MKVGIVGCKGRIGSLLMEELRSGAWADLGLELAGGSERSESVDSLFKTSDVVIDFTSPEGTLCHIRLAMEHKTALIIGTTGLSLEDEGKLKEASLLIPIVYAANMSVGVNMLLALVEQAAARLADDWDIEIFEAHHKHKIDAPSGTALALGKAAASGRDVLLEDVASYARHGKTGARESGAIGFSVMRGGDIVGEHDVSFLSEGERLTLSHKATNRALFAKGALRAALWIGGKTPGLYSMRDVLGL